MAKQLGYRDPMTYRKLGTNPSLRLTNHVLNVERLAQGRHNVELHQYIHELIQGQNPMESDWFKKSVKA